MDDLPELTYDEKRVLESLAVAWNDFLDLPDHGVNDKVEFARLINQAQAQIALRVARRADPTVWRQP